VPAKASKSSKPTAAPASAKATRDAANAIARRGLLLVLSSPSGAGKTTLARRVLENDQKISISVSATTRKPRPGEVDGRDYYFVDEAEFVRRRDSGELLEWAKVFGNYYATPRAPVVKALEEGRDVLFDIDWQGTQQLKERLPHDLVRVFILPPDGKTLEERLRSRAQDSPEVVAKRMAEAAGQISHWAEYDYVIVNSDIDTSHAHLMAILTAERLKRERQLGLSSFVRDVLGSL
jgi:guanylate kinase